MYWFRAEGRFDNYSSLRKLKKAVAVSDEKSRSVPEGRGDFPAAAFLAGKCPNLGRNSISCCWKIGEELSSSVEICRENFTSVA